MEFEKLMDMLILEQDYAKKNFVPIIRKQSAKFLYDFVSENKFKNVLEIGTAIGFSGSIILSASDCKLTSVDINSEYLNIAKNTFEKLNYSSRVQVVNKDAKIFLDELIDANLKYDFIFLDGAKGQYLSYLPKLSKLLDKNGVIFADNVLLGGMVESTEKIPHRKRTMVVNLRKYLEEINKYPYQTELIRLEDGIAITKIKGE